MQKNNAFFAFFYVLKKRTLKNASFFWVSLVAKNSKKDCKRTLHSLKERKRTMLSERKRTQCPTLGKRGGRKRQEKEVGERGRKRRKEKEAREVGRRRRWEKEAEKGGRRRRREKEASTVTFCC